MREIAAIVALAGRPSGTGSRMGRMILLESALRGVVEADPRVPVKLGHRGRTVGSVTGWRMLEDDGRPALIALCALTEDVPRLEVGRAVSAEFTADTTYLGDRDGVHRVARMSVDGLAILEAGTGRMSRPLMPGARIIAVGPATKGSSSRSTTTAAESDARSAWERAGLPVGHSVGNYGGSAPRLK